MVKQVIDYSRLNIPTRSFTFSQLSRISDDNYGVLNRCIDLAAFKNGDKFILHPRMVHHHGQGLPIKPHLRTLVTKFNENKQLAFQDITYEQWEQGQLLEKIAI